MFIGTLGADRSSLGLVKIHRRLVALASQLHLLVNGIDMPDDELASTLACAISLCIQISSVTGVVSDGIEAGSQ